MSLWTFAFCTSLAGLAVLLAYGIVSADLFGQEIWSSEGLEKPGAVVKYAAMAGVAHLQTAEKSKAKSQQSIAKLNSRVAYSPPGMAK